MFDEKLKKRFTNLIRTNTNTFKHFLAMISVSVFYYWEKVFTPVNTWMVA